MSWYVLQCRVGQEREIIASLRQRLSSEALSAAFLFQSERLWRAGGGVWKLITKDMFPGYVFMESENPEKLSRELEEYRGIVRILEEPGYLYSVYAEEEKRLLALCGPEHVLRLSYGYRENGVNCLIDGPLKGIESQIIKADWHRRFAQIEIPVSGKKTIVWAGLGLPEERNLWRAG